MQGPPCRTIPNRFATAFATGHDMSSMQKGRGVEWIVNFGRIPSFQATFTVRSYEGVYENQISTFSQSTIRVQDNPIRHQVHRLSEVA